MRVRYGQLRRFIQVRLMESAGPGPEVSIDEMQAVLDGLHSLKKGQRYGTSARAKFADAGSQLKRMIARQQARSERAIEQPKTFAQLETEVPGKDGGLGRKTSGMGQYDPGFDRRK